MSIERPALQNRWRLLFVSPDEKTSNIFSTQSIDCSINYVSKLFFLTLEQNEGCDTFHKFFIDLAQTNRSCEFYIQTLDGRGDITSSIKINTLDIQDHTFTLDYASKESARHHVTFRVDKFESKLPDDSHYVTEFQLL